MIKHSSAFVAMTAVVSLFCISAQAQDAPPSFSLFFTSQEAHEAEVLAQKIAPAGQGDIHLGAVMYYAPHDWTLWLQGEKWTPDTGRDNLHVLEVTANEVRLSWRGEDGAPAQEFTLKPNQSYQISTGKIISAP